MGGGGSVFLSSKLVKLPVSSPTLSNWLAKSGIKLFPTATCCVKEFESTPLNDRYWLLSNLTYGHMREFSSRKFVKSCGTNPQLTPIGLFFDTFASKSKLVYPPCFSGA